MSTRCPRCGGALVEIVLEREPRLLTMRSCSACDTKEWSTDGEPTDISDVLASLADEGPKRRNRRSR